LIDLEEKKVIAKQNLDITLDKFRIGTITTLEFRTAQLNYVNAKVRYSNAQFQAKTSEIALRELAGNLVFRSDQITTYPDIINILLSSFYEIAVSKYCTWTNKSLYIVVLSKWHCSPYR
jgi:hypothetical protein